MTEKEIKIGFPEVKMEALEFYLQESSTTVEQVLKEHLDKIYEKNVPLQVRKFVESKMDTTKAEHVEAEETTQRQTRGQGRRSTRQEETRVAVQETESAEQQEMEGYEGQEAEQGNSISMAM